MVFYRGKNVHRSAFTYNADTIYFGQLIEKAEAREKERLKEESKKQKRIENSFKNMLKQSAPPLDVKDDWDEVKVAHFTHHFMQYMMATFYTPFYANMMARFYTPFYRKHDCQI